MSATSNFMTSVELSTVAGLLGSKGYISNRFSLSLSTSSEQFVVTKTWALENEKKVFDNNF